VPVNILCLCKRRPLGRDLLEQPYGRFFQLARGLAAAGHRVQILLLDYQRGEEVKIDRDGMTWLSIKLLPLPTRYYSRALAEARAMQADWVLGFSDTWYGICADAVARRSGARSLIDAYDNYEGYMPWARPLHWLWRRALENCDAVTAAGPALLGAMGREAGADARVLPMAADPHFTPRERSTARARLKLPGTTPVVSYSGSMYANRGIERLIEACRILEESRPDIRFVFSGRRDRDYALPANCLHLGYVDDDALLDLYASSNLVLALNTDSTFGRHSHPVKLYEAMAMGVPVLASETPASRYVLRDRPESLLPECSPATLAGRITDVIDRDAEVSPIPAGWLQQVSELEALLRDCPSRAGT
jgi:glycosyltransferase involved in cell wall biosynthesis